ncbi:MAG: Phosphate transporter substrate-binding protein [Chlorobi bacterium]|nr:Phosphate transporter substrate-binding protein [Chlorobiota bacterium]
MKDLMIKSASLVLSALLAVGCGGKSSNSRKQETITDKGSDTMVQLAQRWAEEYGKADSTVKIEVSGGGSGTGISALINGSTDICNASRQMKPDEQKQIKTKFGNEAIEIPVAKDGISIYANEANTTDSLTLEQLRGIFLGQITDWKDVGGTPGKIILYGRENSSGTYEFFKEHVLEKKDFPSIVQTLSGTSAIVSAVTKDQNGIGYGGAGYSKGVKTIKIVSATTKMAIAPTEENVLSGAYPLSRYLYFYVRQTPTGATKNYIDWVLGPKGQALVKELGYFPLKGNAGA